MTVDDFGVVQTVADSQRTYLNGVTFNYTANGMTSQMTLGNGTTESFTTNERFQLTSQSLMRGSEVLQKYNYNYGDLDSSSNLKNNGKLEQIESFIGSNKQWTQNFRYDSIGRLKQTEERRGDTNALTYKQVFDFDRFGNLYRKAASNPTTGQQNPLPFTPIEETTTPGTGDIDRATNRFRAGTTYDEAGQVTQDNKFRSMGFAYDANGRVVKATRVNTPDAHTVYDALGNRVGTKINDVWQYMIYDAFGKLIAEYGIPSEGMGGVKYIQQDHQGSVRAVTNSNGFVVSRTDHQAFGERISSGIGSRTVNQGFGVDTSTRHGYGLTESDDASGQQHTWFRKLETEAGRWSSPDPYKGSLSIGDPQSFNRYSYVGNQPTNLVDPTGLMCYNVIRTDVVVETGQVVGTWVVGTFCTGDGMDLSTPDRVPEKPQNKDKQVYDDCRKAVFGNRNDNRVPSFSVTRAVVDTARFVGISATLLAVTWTGESGFGFFGNSIINNPNDGSPGNVDIGPMQINYNTFVNWAPLYGQGVNGGQWDNAGSVFGSNLSGNQEFNGAMTANVNAGARILKSYSGSDRNRAGLYRTGNGAFRNSRAGRAAYNARTQLYDSLKNLYDKFFDCIRKG
jgi:RHS repeat-associated protein